MHPTAILNQSVERYETGMLKSVSRNIFNRVIVLKHQAERALAEGGKRKIEKLKEDISGRKAGYSLYQAHGFTRFDMAPGVLGMKKKAFDLMVAKNCEIFRSVGRYTKRWYLSDLYLKELSEKEFFDLVSAKYEFMAKTLSRSGRITPCML